jgi:hypothetical protein
VVVEVEANLLPHLAELVGVVMAQILLLLVNQAKLIRAAEAEVEEYIRTVPAVQAVPVSLSFSYPQLQAHKPLPSTVQVQS